MWRLPGKERGGEDPEDIRLVHGWQRRGDSPLSQMVAIAV